MNVDLVNGKLQQYVASFGFADERLLADLQLELSIFQEGVTKIKELIDSRNGKKHLLSLKVWLKTRKWQSGLISTDIRNRQQALRKNEMRSKRNWNQQLHWI
jgi:hypothetical protein